MDEVVFTGHVDDDELLACYRWRDLFLCLSEHEGFCVPLLEAMVFGLPVVAYDAGAVRETLRGGGRAARGEGPGGGGRAGAPASLRADERAARRPVLRTTGARARPGPRAHRTSARCSGSACRPVLDAA